MEISLGTNNSEKNKIGKSVVWGMTVSGTLKDETSVTDPAVIMEVKNPTLYNYAYIPEFNRYYFISDMVSVKNRLWRITMHVDVLESFKNQINDLNVILSDSQITGANEYLSGNVWKTKVKEKTDIISFSSGLNNSGEFILITAGG